MEKPWEIPDDVWAEVVPLLPHVVRARRNPGRRRLDDRKALSGVLFVLYTGLPWELLPRELGYGSGVTCWRRLREWQGADTWPLVRHVLTTRLATGRAVDWDRTNAALHRVA